MYKRQVRNSGIFDEILVAADDERIREEILKYGGKVIMTSTDHQSGSDRIAEAVKYLEVDVIVNVQGDEPFVHPETLKTLVDAFKNDFSEETAVATLKEIMTEGPEIQNPNNVKVVTDNRDFALYFSRSPIPFNRDGNSEVKYFKHVGIYAYRKQALMNFTELNPGILEQTEKLEQLRFLENSYKIKVLETGHKTIGIDTPEDLAAAQEFLKNMEQ